MLSTLPVLLLSGVITAVVVASGRLSRRPSRTSELAAASPALVLTGVIGQNRPLMAAIDARPRLAPAESDTTAIRVLAADGSVLADVAATEIELLRVVSDGQELCLLGHDRRGRSRQWPVGTTFASWEIQLIATTGQVLHVYGAPQGGATADLGRLVSRVRAAQPDLVAV